MERQAYRCTGSVRGRGLRIRQTIETEVRALKKRSATAAAIVRPECACAKDGARDKVLLVGGLAC
jgi:hypothetical protein